MAILNDSDTAEIQVAAKLFVLAFEKRCIESEQGVKD